MLNIGFAGAHRTGKTTLAAMVAHHLNLPLVATRITDLFTQQHVKPDQPFTFATRLAIQNHLLAATLPKWEIMSTGFVTDRTPIDFMAYTLADIQGHTQVNFAELEDYLTRCFQATDRLFTHLIIVQPGIPLVYESGKAALNQSYLEHLNFLIQGLCQDERLHCCSTFKLDRQILNFEHRLQNVLDHLNK